jgi:superfamily II DNA or RNA helicase
LITRAMSDNHSLKFDSYDRMFPNQDTLPNGGFGNLIALPLQKHPRQYGNSVFVDNNFNVISDQWSFLSRIKRYALDETEELIRLICPQDELGILKKDIENEQPWEKKKQTIDLSGESFPDSITIVKANMIYLDKTGLSDKTLNHLKRFAAFKNPEFYKAQAMRMPVYNKPRIISISEETDKYLCLPRGLEDEIKAFFKEHNVKLEIENKYNTGSKIKVEFNGTLRDEQQKAADALLSHFNGILAATTAFGKTVVGAYLIGKRKRNTLILVHRTQLMTQWKEKLSEFLNIDEELPVQSTKRGRKKRCGIIGQLGGGKNDLHGVIDIAVIQSLLSGDDVKDLVRNYGMVIVDECHHISAFSFEKVLKEVNAKYVYGLTATPTRQDGHHPIIYMQCGNIRYSVNAKEQAEKRPFEHYIIPKFTRLNIEDSDSKSITEIYKYIYESEIRNEQIINDVVSSVKNGKNPVILTERTSHVEYLAKKLSEADLPNVIPLTGGLTAKKSRELLEQVRNIPEDENFVLVATGKYIGEGFDMARLDTLFLAMPISWKGTLQQYAGRLHRLCDNKTEVVIYDYVDIRVSVLEKMYQKRLKGYASIGYKAKGETTAIDDINIIFNTSNFLSVYANDIAASQKEIIIVSPFLTKRRINLMLKTLINSPAKITVVTRPCDDYKENDVGRINECIKILEMNNIAVKTKSKIHQKYSLIDNRIVWYGSINLLSYGTSEESIMRIESENIANELLGIII